MRTHDEKHTLVVNRACLLTSNTHYNDQLAFVVIRAYSLKSNATHNEQHTLVVTRAPRWRATRTYDDQHAFVVNRAYSLMRNAHSQ